MKKIVIILVSVLIAATSAAYSHENVMRAFHVEEIHTGENTTDVAQGSLQNKTEFSFLDLL